MTHCVEGCVSEAAFNKQNTLSGQNKFGVVLRWVGQDQGFRTRELECCFPSEIIRLALVGRVKDVTAFNYIDIRAGWKKFWVIPASQVLWENVAGKQLDNSDIGYKRRGFMANVFVSNVYYYRQTDPQRDIKDYTGWSKPSPIGFPSRVSLAIGFNEGTGSKYRSGNSGESYTDIQGITITPVKLFGCAVLFFGGMLVVAISMTGRFRFIALSMVIGALSALVGGVLALPL